MMYSTQIEKHHTQDVTCLFFDIWWSYERQIDVIIAARF